MHKLYQSRRVIELTQKRHSPIARRLLAWSTIGHLRSSLSSLAKARFEIWVHMKAPEQNVTSELIERTGPLGDAER